MNVGSRNVFELRAPSPDELTTGIKLDRLSQGVEKIYFSCADTCCKVPTSVVALDIMINQFFLEVMRPISPVLLKVKRQESSDNLSTTVAHKSCLI